jgi:large-conductance mechanosensitive channel
MCDFSSLPMCVRVTALVNDLLMPIIAAVIPREAWRTTVFEVNPVKFLLGDIVGALINYIIIMLVVFLLSKSQARARLLYQVNNLLHIWRFYGEN